MSSKLVSGVYAAAMTPRHADGTLDVASFRKSIEFLLKQGIRGLALNGATGEFCLTSRDELRRILELAVDVMAGQGKIVCGIGSASVTECIEKGRLAADGGAIALLLPMPYFFPYAQDDLDAFCRTVAEESSVPVLLYNLPEFTTGLEPSTVQNLVMTCTNIIGIKDSSGSLEILQSLTRAGIECCRMVGSDNVLAEALRKQVCDGVISGVACVLPEVICSLFAYSCHANSAEFIRATRELDELIQQLGHFPVPWGLKLIAESRRIAPASFAQPLSTRRVAQSREFQEWFQAWQSKAAAPCPDDTARISCDGYC
jgi:4-hydroxy-tetrahydrodipicolinate synthase